MREQTKAIPWGITLILESLYSLRRFSSDFAQQINNDLHLTPKYPRIFVYAHYVFQERKILVNFLAKRRLLKFIFFTHKYTQRKRLFLFFVYTFLSVLWCDFIIKQVHLSTIKCTPLFHLVFNDSFRGG